MSAKKEKEIRFLLSLDIDELFENIGSGYNLTYSEILIEVFPPVVLGAMFKPYYPRIWKAFKSKYQKGKFWVKQNATLLQRAICTNKTVRKLRREKADKVITISVIADYIIRNTTDLDERFCLNVAVLCFKLGLDEICSGKAFREL